MRHFKLDRNGIPLFFFAAAAALCMLGCSTASSDDPGSKGKDGASGPIVLRIGDESFTLAQLDDRAKKLGLKPYQDLYEHRRQAIEQMVAETLMDREAAAAGITRDDVMRREVNDKVPPIADSDVTGFYEQNKANMAGRELDDDLRVQIRNYLGQQGLVQARQEYLVRLRSQAKVEISLEAPRVDLVVLPHEPARGPADAPVTIVEYSDFECPYCARVGPTLDRVAQAYPDKVRIVFRDFPLPMHPEAQPAAEAARCAHEQGQFWQYHDKLFEGQRELGAESFKKFAAQLGLDAERFAACYDGGRFREDVMLSAREAQQLGVTGTPAFFVNGRFLNGAIGYERLQTIIEEELGAPGS